MLTWKSSFTEKETHIFRGKLIVGLLKTNAWKSEAHAELDGYLLRFKDKGFFKRITEIQDIEGNKIFGEIKYSGWGRSATITYEEVAYEWKYKSWIDRSWHVQRGEDKAEFKLTHFWGKKGEIENENIPPAVILAALYARLHFKKVAAAVSAGT
jgi:hypothetical protein